VKNRPFSNLVLLSSIIKALRIFARIRILKVPNVSEMRRLKEAFRNSYLSGFFLDENTFLKADDAEVLMVPRRNDDGKVVERPMIVLKNVVEMLVDHSGRIVSVENKGELAVWTTAVEHALKRFNKQLSAD
jgi:hypothetical protein